MTPFIYNHPERYAVGSLEAAIDRSNFRWTVDWPEDFEFVRTIFEALYLGNREFGTEDIVELVTEHPEIAAINAARIESSVVQKNLRYRLKTSWRTMPRSANSLRLEARQPTKQLIHLHQEDQEIIC